MPPQSRGTPEGTPHRDVLERGVDDLVVVGQAVEFECVQIEEHMVAQLHAVDVGVGLQPAACRDNAVRGTRGTGGGHRAVMGRGRGHRKDTYGGAAPTGESLSSPSNHPVLWCPHCVPPQASSLYPLTTPRPWLFPITLPGRIPVPGCPHSPGVPQQHPIPLVLHPSPWMSFSSPPLSPSVPSQQYWGVPDAHPQQHPSPYVCPQGSTTILAVPCVPPSSPSVFPTSLCPPSSLRGRLTLEVLPADEAGIDIDVRQGNGAELLEVEVQNTPGRTRQCQRAVGELGGHPGTAGPLNTPATHLLMVSR